MKHLRETFTDQEFATLQRAKSETELNWHDFIMLLVGADNMKSLIKKFKEQER